MRHLFPPRRRRGSRAGCRRGPRGWRTRQAEAPLDAAGRESGLRVLHRVVAEVEDARREHCTGPPLDDPVRDVVQVADSARGDDRDPDRVGDRSGAREVEAVPVHAGEQDLAGPQGTPSVRTTRPRRGRSGAVRRGCRPPIRTPRHRHAAARRPRSRCTGSASWPPRRRRGGGSQPPPY